MISQTRADTVHSLAKALWNEDAVRVRFQITNILNISEASKCSDELQNPNIYTYTHVSTKQASIQESKAAIYAGSLVKHALELWQKLSDLSLGDYHDNLQEYFDAQNALIEELNSLDVDVSSGMRGLIFFQGLPEPLRAESASNATLSALIVESGIDYPKLIEFMAGFQSKQMPTTAPQTNAEEKQESASAESENQNMAASPTIALEETQF